MAARKCLNVTSYVQWWLSCCIMRVCVCVCVKLFVKYIFKIWSFIFDAKRFYTKIMKYFVVCRLCVSCFLFSGLWRFLDISIILEICYIFGGTKRCFWGTVFVYIMSGFECQNRTINWSLYVHFFFLLTFSLNFSLFFLISYSFLPFLLYVVPTVIIPTLK